MILLVLLTDPFQALSLVCLRIVVPKVVTLEVLTIVIEGSGITAPSSRLWVKLCKSASVGKPDMLTLPAIFKLVPSQDKELPNENLPSSSA